jgi:iron complex outermembrane receptor protein
MIRTFIRVTLLVLAVVSEATAQDAVLRVRVIRPDSQPIAGVQVRLDTLRARTDTRGEARMVTSPGSRLLSVARIGYAPDSATVVLRPGVDTLITFMLVEHETALAGVTVSATRSERRIEDDPVRVEVLEAEEVVEKLLMTPGDITMMLNETSGLRVQVTSPSLGGASVRVQGLRGRYTQVLSDGLPLYGGQTGGLGLLQIPPMDLGGVEIIKGVASALNGGSALGGVVNLTSRRPTAAPIRELMLNRTTLGGTDVVLFTGGLAASGQTEADAGWGYTLLSGWHGQDQVDRDGDDWADLPGYSRALIRPRAFWSSPEGDQAMITAGGTFESRDGGTMPDGLAPDGQPYPERLRTTRYDAGGFYRRRAGESGLVNLRGSYSYQGHRHTFGAVVERDEHESWFGEGTYTISRGTQTWVVGAALLTEEYNAEDVEGFDYSFTTPGLLSQVTLDAGARLAVTASVRADWHSEYGAVVSPRLSALYRLGDPWTLRASVGSGFFGPTPFTEETEVVGLHAMLPLKGIVKRACVRGVAGPGWFVRCGGAQL